MGEWRVNGKKVYARVSYYKAVINILFEKCGYNRIVCVSLLDDARIGFNILLLVCVHVCACQHEIRRLGSVVRCEGVFCLQ